MNSEFKRVNLDIIRYSLVWEGHETLYNGLDIHPNDKLLVITSAGCNVLNSLLKRPAKVVAIDLNPEQNRLLSFKKHIIQNHDIEVLQKLMGFHGKDKVETTWEAVRNSSNIVDLKYWDTFFLNHPEGLVTVGKLETYLNSFYNSLSDDYKNKLHHLISFENVEDQWMFYKKELHETSFPEHFTEYFDQINLSKGRDPNLFKYTSDSGGATFYSRLVKQLSTTLVSRNFFFRFFFFGAENIPHDILPPCYQKANALILREQLNNLEIVTGEAIEYLLSENGEEITKASLSNIFEYTDDLEFKSVCKELIENGSRTLKILFWNLLQDHGCDTSSPYIKTELSNSLSKREACFYFRNVKVMTNE